MARNSMYVNDSGMRKRMEAIPKIVGKEAQDVMMQLGKIGEQEMKLSLFNAPTPFAKIRSKYGVGPAKGRMRTKSMFNSIGYKLRSGLKQLQVQVGYIRGQKKAYYAIQDGSDTPYGGFINKWRFVGFGPGTSGPNAPNGFLFAPAQARVTQGTLGLRNAREKIQTEKKRLFANAERRIARLANK